MAETQLLLFPDFRMVFDPGSVVRTTGSLGTIADVKSRFFNVGAIERRVVDENYKLLSLTGRDIRQKDRQSIRKPPRKTLKSMTPDERRRFRIQQAMAKRDGRSAPKKPMVEHGAPEGHAPFDRTGLLRQHIYYAYDHDTDSVVVGAALLKDTDGGEDVPQTIEEGGVAEITYGSHKGRRVQLGARPHTTPAYEKMKPKISRMWANRF